jgi:hypothetical protein
MRDFRKSINIHHLVGDIRVKHPTTNVRSRWFLGSSGFTEPQLRSWSLRAGCHDHHHDRWVLFHHVWLLSRQMGLVPENYGVRPKIWWFVISHSLFSHKLRWIPPGVVSEKNCGSGVQPFWPKKVWRADPKSNDSANGLIVLNHAMDEELDIFLCILRWRLLKSPLWL